MGRDRAERLRGTHWNGKNTRVWSLRLPGEWEFRVDPKGYVFSQAQPIDSSPVWMPLILDQIDSAIGSEFDPLCFEQLPLFLTAPYFVGRQPTKAIDDALPG